MGTVFKIKNKTNTESMRKKIGTIGFMHGIKGSFDRSELATLLEPIHQGLLGMDDIPKEIHGTFYVGKNRFSLFELEEITKGYNVYHFPKEEKLSFEALKDTLNHG